MEQALTSTQSKIFTIESISLGTFLGGPLAAGYLVYANLKTLDEPQKALKALWMGIIGTLILFGSILFIPESISSKIPNQVIPFAYTLAIYYWCKQHLDLKIKRHLENGGLKASGWKAAGIGLVCLLISFVYILILIFFMPMPDQL